MLNSGSLTLGSCFGNRTNAGRADVVPVQAFFHMFKELMLPEDKEAHAVKGYIILAKWSGSKIPDHVVKPKIPVRSPFLQKGESNMFPRQ